MFKLALHKRVRVAARRRKRYWDDPAYRLVIVNRNRARAGLPELASADEIRSYSEGGKITASKRQRNDDGTFA